MKKILSVIVSVIVSVGMNAQVVKVYDTKTSTTEPVATYTNDADHTYKVVFEEIPTTGTAKAKLDGTNEVDVTWVQLWAGGPKFATINVGQTVTDYSSIATATYSLANVGGYYTWGGTVNSNGGNYSDDHNQGSAVLTGNNDTATKLWGSAWRMPTQEELNSLNNSSSCTWEWCDGETGDGHKQYVSGCTLKGYKVSGVGAYASNSVFFPAAGYYTTNQRKVISQGSDGGCWSSMPVTNQVAAYALSLNSYSKSVGGWGSRFGFSVRAVLKE